MLFARKLELLLNELEISQTQLSSLTGIGKSSISQYLSGKVEPSNKRRKDIALALGLQENYFESFNTATTALKDSEMNLSVSIAAKLMGKSKEWVTQGLKDGVFPWGYAVKMEKWSYFISSTKFTEHTGIRIPSNLEHEETLS